MLKNPKEQRVLMLKVLKHKESLVCNILLLQKNIVNSLVLLMLKITFSVLGASREWTKAEISKAYRKLAGKNHPDRFIDKEEKQKAEKNFLLIAAA